MDGIVTVFGEDDSLVCEVYLDEVLEKCPHGYGYTSDRHSDRAHHYRVETSEIWEESSARVGMVWEVWDELTKKWVDENGEEIIFPPNHSEMRWIRVEDRIPTEDREYLAITRYKYIPSYMDGIEWLAVGTCYLRSFHTPYSADNLESAVIVLWMEMPSLPENLEP